MFGRATTPQVMMEVEAMQQITQSTAVSTSPLRVPQSPPLGVSGVRQADPPELHLDCGSEITDTGAFMLHQLAGRAASMPSNTSYNPKMP